MYCTSCQGEFLNDMKTCSSCRIDLVSKDDYLAKIIEKKSICSTKEDLLSFFEGGLSQVREIEGLFNKAGIPSLLKGHSQDCDKKGCGASFSLWLRSEDMKDAEALLQKRFHGEVQREGQGALVTEAVDLSLEQIKCPACHEIGPLKEGECSCCGLFLGIAQ